MIEMRTSKSEEAYELRELFQLCSGADPARAGAYFGRRFPPEEFLVLREDGALAAAVWLRNVTLTEPDGRTVKAAYLRMATHPDHRGRGFAAQLMNYADFFLHGKRDCVISAPVGEELRAFYARFGFSECFPLLEGEVTPRLPGPGECARPVGAAEYDALRETLLAGTYHVSCGGLTGLQEDLCARAGGGLLALEVGGLPGCAAVERRDNTALVRELLCAPEALEGAAALAAQSFPARHVRLRRPAFWPVEGLERKNCGMVKWYDPIAARRWTGAEEAYLGLTLD